MTVRTSIKTVTFRKPFFLGGFDEVLPAGAYSIETDEELLAGISFPAYRRILTAMHLHADPGRPGVERLLTIDPQELDAALERDRAPAEVPVGRGAHRETLIRAVRQREEQIDRWAVDRAEDEGMTVCPGQTAVARRRQETASWPSGEGQSAPYKDTLSETTSPHERGGHRNAIAER